MPAWVSPISQLQGLDMGNFSLPIIVLAAHPGLTERAAETGTNGIETWGLPVTRGF